MYAAVKPVNAEFRSKWQAEKAAAKEAQKRRRDQELDDRRAQTAACPDGFSDGGCVEIGIG